MNIIIEAPFSMVERDRIVIESKINYLKRYESRMIKVSVFFKTDIGSNPNDVLCGIRIDVPGYDLFAEQTDSNAMRAFSASYNSIKRQVKQRRRKLNDQWSPVKEINEIVNNTY